MQSLRIRTHKAVAEGIGTFAIVFAGCGSLMVAERFPGSIPGMAVPVVFGLIVTSMVYALGHISGAHFNPAVTAAFAVARHFPFRQVLLYWIAQTAGAIAAITLLTAILPAGQTFGASIPSVDPLQAVVWEAVLTFLLMIVIIAVATDTRAVGVMAGAAIGATVLLGAAVGGPVSGASMNPARSLAPALFQHTLGNFWIYVTGPMIGAIAAAIAYELIRGEGSKAKDARERR